MKRPRNEVKQVMLRLAREDHIRIDVLAKELKVSKEALVRWGCRGKNGVFLDVGERADRSWYTSRPAIARFTIELAAKGMAIPFDDSDAKGARKNQDIARAVRLVNSEGLVPAETLAAEVGVGESELISWIVAGTDGHYLDGLSIPRSGWFSSRQAVERFLDATNFDERQPSRSRATT